MGIVDIEGAALWLMLALGAYHGINPGMGWLFAVSLGLREKNGAAVAKSLVPIALGHALAVGAVVLAGALLGIVMPAGAIAYLVATVLIVRGIHILVRHRHPRWVRMQVGFRDLATWSFLMASAHGAGWMVLPALLNSPGVGAAGQIGFHDHGAMAGGPVDAVLATAVHTIGYLAVTGLVAWVVYRKLGLALLRTAWFNFDLGWGVALVISGIVTLLM